MTDSVNQRVRLLAGRYEIGPLIGRGGMADVRAGTDARLGRRVAIKLLKPALASDPAFRTRFRREAQDAAKMAHPTIVRIFDAGEETVIDPSGNEAQIPFIVMEYVDGRLLKDIIAEGPLPEHEAVRIASQMLTALEYSHRAGVVHRDIKPGNIMIASNGQVKVMDFGIARAVAESSATITETSAIVGTAQYFSPEQARGESVDARTDLYSTARRAVRDAHRPAAVPRREPGRRRLPARQPDSRAAELAQPRRFARRRRRRRARAFEGSVRSIPERDRVPRTARGRRQRGARPSFARSFPPTTSTQRCSA